MGNEGYRQSVFTESSLCSGQEAALDAWCERTEGISLRCNKGLSCVKLFFSHGSVMRLGVNVWKIEIYLGEVVFRLMMLLYSWQTPL